MLFANSALIHMVRPIVTTPDTSHSKPNIPRPIPPGLLRMPRMSKPLWSTQSLVETHHVVSTSQPSHVACAVRIRCGTVGCPGPPLTEARREAGAAWVVVRSPSDGEPWQALPPLRATPASRSLDQSSFEVSSTYNTTYSSQSTNYY
jgi:hypothetical protein